MMNGHSPSTTMAFQPIVDANAELDTANDLDQLIYLVIDTVQSPHTKRAYRRALQDFLTYWRSSGKPTPTKAFVQHYISHLLDHGMGESSVAQRLVAIRRLFHEAADNGFIPYSLAIPISRVKGPQVRGCRIGNWLTKKQAEALLNAPDVSVLKGKRDRAILAVLISAGLRRQEVVDMTIEHLQIRESRWVIVDLIGKRRKIRSVPIPHWTRHCIDEWLEGAGITQGRLFRAMRKGNRVVSTRMSTKAIRKVVKEYADQIGIEVAPHDLRRTYAKLARKGGAPLEQIQITLGHQSLETTQKYLGTDLDYAQAACDYIGLYFSGG